MNDPVCLSSSGQREMGTDAVSFARVITSRDRDPAVIELSRVQSATSAVSVRGRLAPEGQWSCRPGMRRRARRASPISRWGMWMWRKWGRAGHRTRSAEHLHGGASLSITRSVPLRPLLSVILPSSPLYLASFSLASSAWDDPWAPTPRSHLLCWPTHRPRTTLWAASLGPNA